MKAMIEIEDCRKCPFHKSYDVETPDSFDNFLDIYCRKIDSSDGKGRRICQVDGPEKALVPSWCPYIIERYKFIIEQLDRRGDDKRKRNDRHPEPTKRVKKCTSLRELTSQILQELERHCFSTFVYHTKFCPTERDLCLAAIISESRGLTYFHYPIWVFFDLDAEDIEIIKNETERIMEMVKAFYYYDLVNADKDRAADIIKKFEQKESEARAKNVPLVLGTELAVPLAILMADAVSHIPSDLEGVTVEFKFVDHGNDTKDNPCPTESVELHYYWPNNSTVPTRELLTNDSEAEAALSRILKEIFGIKELTFYINDKIIIRTSLDT